MISTQLLPMPQGMPPRSLPVPMELSVKPGAHTQSVRKPSQLPRQADADSVEMTPAAREAILWAACNSECGGSPRSTQLKEACQQHWLWHSDVGRSTTWVTDDRHPHTGLLVMIRRARSAAPFLGPSGPALISQIGGPSRTTTLDSVSVEASWVKIEVTCCCFACHSVLPVSASHSVE